MMNRAIGRAVSDAALVAAREQRRARICSYHIIRASAKPLVKLPGPEGQILFASISLHLQIDHLSEAIVHPYKLASTVKHNGRWPPYQRSLWRYKDMPIVALLIPLGKIDHRRL